MNAPRILGVDRARAALAHRIALVWAPALGMPAALEAARGAVTPLGHVEGSAEQLAREALEHRARRGVVRTNARSIAHLARLAGLVAASRPERWMNVETSHTTLIESRHNALGIEVRHEMAEGAPDRLRAYRRGALAAELRVGVFGRDPGEVVLTDEATPEVEGFIREALAEGVRLLRDGRGIE